VLSHPIQYFSPWFSHLARVPGIALKVFYLWDFGVVHRRDREFGIDVKWDIPMLEGYEHEFVANSSSAPGTHHFRGLDNPGLVARVQTWKPDVILLFGYAYLSHLRLLLSPALRKVPIILRGDSHNLGRDGQWWRSRVTRQMRRLLFCRIGAFLAVGLANSEYFAACAQRPEQVFLARHFVDNERFRGNSKAVSEEAFAWRRELGIPAGARVIGFVGKLDPVKRPADLLAATRSLPMRPDGSATVTLFVGTGMLERTLRVEADDRIGVDVFFAPFQNQSAMSRVYAAVDLLVLPSANETWGLCVNEAMNLGVPAIVSDRVGCGPDLVIPGETGWTFRTGDVSDLRRVVLIALQAMERDKAGFRTRVLRHVDAFSMENATQGLLRAVHAVLPGWSLL
jgi:glycosyltransferase involved in cell wall biosynthesis